MKISIVAIGTKMPAWVNTGCQEYLKRFSHDMRVSLIELPHASHKDKEGQAIIKAIPPSTHVIALDVKGKNVSTEMLANKINQWKQETPHVSIIIGGPDGLSDEVLAKATEKLSFSDLTFPHPLVRIILVEQLYRALSITQNHPYHRV